VCFGTSRIALGPFIDIVIQRLLHSLRSAPAHRKTSHGAELNDRMRCDMTSPPDERGRIAPPRPGAEPGDAHRQKVYRQAEGDGGVQELLEQAERDRKMGVTR